MDISKFEFPVKDHQTREELEELMAKAYARYSSAGTGADGDQFEIATVQLMTVCGVQTEYVRAQGRVDLVLYFFNSEEKRREAFRFEIKSGSGIVAQLKPRLGLRTIAEYSEADILPKADYVVYAAKPGEFESVDDLLDNSVVMTRAEFIAMVESAGGKRKSGFETCFSVQCNSKLLARWNNELPELTEIYNEKGKPVLGKDKKPLMVPTTRTIKDKKTGEEKKTRRGCPRWTDCIVMQTSYLEQRAAAVEMGLATGEMTSLRTWLEEHGRL